MHIRTTRGFKPLVYCKRPKLIEVINGAYVAMLKPLSQHPRCNGEGMIKTSRILSIDFEAKQLETLNTVYDWRQR